MVVAVARGPMPSLSFRAVSLVCILGRCCHIVRMLTWHPSRSWHGVRLCPRQQQPWYGNARRVRLCLQQQQLWYGMVWYGMVW